MCLHFHCSQWLVQCILEGCSVDRSWLSLLGGLKQLIWFIVWSAWINCQNMSALCHLRTNIHTQHLMGGLVDMSGVAQELFPFGLASGDLKGYLIQLPRIILDIPVYATGSPFHLPSSRLRMTHAKLEQSGIFKGYSQKRCQRNW